jgi:hypothetical protein
MPVAIPFGFGDRESLVLALDLPAKIDSGYDWISCHASIKAGSFEGKADLYIVAGDLVPFSEQVEALYRTLRGEAVLNTLEGQIDLRLVGDGKGHIKLHGELLDRCGIGNKLSFVIEYDQTLLWQTISALRDVLAQIRTRGTSAVEPQ